MNGGDEMRHATPSVRYTLEGPCPLGCGGLVSEEPATAVDTYAPGYYVAGRALPTRERLTTVAACSGCEFLIDLRRPDGVPKTSTQLLAEVGRFVAEKNRG